MIEPARVRLTVASKIDRSEEAYKKWWIPDPPCTEAPQKEVVLEAKT